jgi:cysteine desulfurase/selenocysteine lyase
MAPHVPVNMQAMGVDFVVFSAHKMLGPMGVGVLVARRELLEDMEPMVLGGGMVGAITKDKMSWAEVPDKFEPGTRNIEGVAGLGAAIDYLQDIGMEKVAAHEAGLTTYALEQFLAVPGVTVYGPKEASQRLGVVSFAIDGVHTHDVAEILNRAHVAVRTGHHCAQVLMQCLGVSGTVRVSLSLYNTRADVDALMVGIGAVKKTFRIT